MVVYQLKTIVSEILIATIFVAILTGIEAVENESTMNILNGQLAEYGAFPFVVAFYYNGKVFCTGSLIAPNVVLSAAHCFAVHKQGYCIAGQVDHKRWSSTRQMTTIHAIFKHPMAYKAGKAKVNGEYDLAVVMLNSPFTLTKYISTIEIADDPLQNGDNCIAMGFGPNLFESMGGAKHDAKLRYGNFEVKEEFCNPSRSLYASVYCIAPAKGYQTPYYGDSGGPMINPIYPHRLYGVASEIQKPIYYAYYANAVEHKPWIMSHLSIQGEEFTKIDGNWSKRVRPRPKMAGKSLDNRYRKWRRVKNNGSMEIDRCAYDSRIFILGNRCTVTIWMILFSYYVRFLIGDKFGI